MEELPGICDIRSAACPSAASFLPAAGKFNLAELYEKIGYGKTLISKGKYAELLADNRPFTEVCACLSCIMHQPFNKACVHTSHALQELLQRGSGLGPAEVVRHVAILAE